MTHIQRRERVLVEQRHSMLDPGHTALPHPNVETRAALCTSAPFLARTTLTGDGFLDAVQLPFFFLNTLIVYQELHEPCMCQLEALVHEATSSFQGLETYICLKCCFYLSLEIISAFHLHYSFYIRILTTENMKFCCSCTCLFFTI